MSKGHTLQDPYLNLLRKERVPVSIYLVNGIKLQGQIESFDQFCRAAQETRSSQMVYKHAISTVVPGRVVRLPMQHPPAEDGGLKPVPLPERGKAVQGRLYSRRATGRAAGLSRVVRALYFAPARVKHPCPACFLSCAF